MGVLSSDDLDGPFDAHSYSITGPVGAPFSVGGNNMRTLLVNGSLDHETNPTLLVIIRVTDKGGLFTQKTFKITVNGEFWCTDDALCCKMSSMASLDLGLPKPSILNAAQCWGQGTTPGLGVGGAGRVPISDFIWLASMP